MFFKGNTKGTYPFGTRYVNLIIDDQNFAASVLSRFL